MYPQVELPEGDELLGSQWCVCPCHQSDVLLFNRRKKHCRACRSSGIKVTLLLVTSTSCPQLQGGVTGAPPSLGVPPFLGVPLSLEACNLHGGCKLLEGFHPLWGGGVTSLRCYNLPGGYTLHEGFHPPCGSSPAAHIFRDVLPCSVVHNCQDLLGICSG